MQKLMAFVDGTNLLTEMGKKIGASYSAYTPSDEVISLGAMIVNEFLNKRLCFEVSVTDYTRLRKYWFGSYQGSPEGLLNLKTMLRKREYEPMIYQKFKGGREKKVDIAVAKEMLINAFHHNYDIALLVAGDEDYVDLVQDLKRYGVFVIGAFFPQGRSPDLELACDRFCTLEIWGDGYKALEQKIRSEFPPHKSK